ncbi:methylation-associated defense system restriction endonuclease subunit S MAD5 [Empedobacter brevis]
MEITQIKSKTILDNSFILKPGYHMNYGKKRIEKAIYSKFPFDNLGNVCASVFTGGIFKRVFVDDSQYGDPYISAQHMMNTNPLDVAKIISKKYTPKQEEMSLKENQILVSCAGTVGNIRLITKDLEGVIGSQDIIRINPDKTKLPYGYLYAYLASKTAYNYMQSYIYGSVVPRIEPNTLSKLPVPILSEEKQQQIHQLIVEASELSVKANSTLTSIIKEIESNFTLTKRNKTETVSIREIMQGDKYTSECRLEADFYSNSIKEVESQIKKNNHSMLGDLVHEIYRSGLRERKFVKENGIPMITGQDLSQRGLGNLKQLSKKFTKNIEKSTTKNKDILISVQGTIGRIEYVLNNQYKGVFASEQLSKITVNEALIHPGYIFAFLKSEIGQVLLNKYKTGSIIEWIKENNIASVLIPIPSDFGNRIGMEVDKYAELLNLSITKENQAIALIEKEIDLWQVS